MLVASLFPALITSHAPGAMYASQSLKFAAPVHVRDEVVAQFATKCLTDDEETFAIDGEAMAFSAHAAAQRRGNRVTIWGGGDVTSNFGLLSTYTRGEEEKAEKDSNKLRDSFRKDSNIKQVSMAGEASSKSDKSKSEVSDKDDVNEGG
ncbi:hypothetical protein TRIUR3_06976 [Triticum urartu]|uniref:Uncharacterized protein n=1 Tax=Triticum urartu TaxID=4572 RepID=M7ZTC8_TRIUA|nr:hypothetical protein TRIUR3_06976 [Triticum urartu]